MIKRKRKRQPKKDPYTKSLNTLKNIANAYPINVVRSKYNLYREEKKLGGGNHTLKPFYFMYQKYQYNKRIVDKCRTNIEHHQEEAGESTTEDTENAEIQENIGSTENIEIEEENEGNNTSNEDNNDELDLFENFKRRQHDHSFHKVLFLQQSTTNFKDQRSLKHVQCNSRNVLTVILCDI